VRVPRDVRRLKIAGCAKGCEGEDAGNLVVLLSVEGFGDGWREDQQGFDVLRAAAREEEARHRRIQEQAEKEAEEARRQAASKARAEAQVAQNEVDRATEEEAKKAAEAEAKAEELAKAAARRRAEEEFAAKAEAKKAEQEARLQALMDAPARAKAAAEAKFRRHEIETKITAADKRWRSSWPEGILGKRGSGFLSGWKKRWFCFQPGRQSCSYYSRDPQTGGEIKGAIDMSACIQPPELEEDGKTIHVFTEDREWRLRAASKKDGHTWVEAFKRMHRGQPPLEGETAYKRKPTLARKRSLPHMPGEAKSEFARTSGPMTPPPPRKKSASSASAGSDGWSIETNEEGIFFYNSEEKSSTFWVEIRDGEHHYFWNAETDDSQYGPPTKTQGGFMPWRPGLYELLDAMAEEDALA
jgi:hypothetical protein